MFAFKGAWHTYDHAAAPASVPFLRGIPAGIEVVGMRFIHRKIPAMIQFSGKSHS